MFSMIVAIRTRSEGDWHDTPHFANMEIMGGYTSAVTSVSKDNLVMEVYHV